MGCGMSTEEKEGKERNEQIENQLKRDKLSQRNEIKMLLLGTTVGGIRKRREWLTHVQELESRANRPSSNR